MKAILSAIFVLVMVDLGFDHGQQTRRVMACVVGIGHAVGSWVYYS